MALHEALKSADRGLTQANAVVTALRAAGTIDWRIKLAGMLISAGLKAVALLIDHLNGVEPTVEQRARLKQDCDDLLAEMKADLEQGD